MYRVQAFDREGREVASLEAQSGEITIGREADRRIVLPSPSVSRRHAKLVLDGPQPFIVDEGSANGVLVNGVKIAGPTALVPGTRVDIAEFRLEFTSAVMTEAVRPIADRRFPAAAAPAPSASGFGAPLRLSAQGGPFAGQVFEVPQGQSSVGRAIDNDLVFDDPSLSRKHCRLRHNGDHVEIEDLGSSNGTFVNGQKIDRGSARAGDVVRFGELHFNLEGDQPFEANAPADDYAPPPARRGIPPVAIYVAAGVLVLIIGAGLATILRGKKGNAGGDSIALLAAQAQAHLKAGKDKLESKDFVGAAKEFDQVLDGDPANAEARRLKSVAAAEPQNETLSKTAKAKAVTASSRADLEAVLKLLAQIPAESVFRDATAQKVGSRLVAFGEGQCKAKKYADCGWAICKASDVVPAAERAAVVPPEADAALREAEKKLVRDRSYVPCKKR